MQVCRKDGFVAETQVNKNLIWFNSFYFQLSLLLWTSLEPRVSVLSIERHKWTLKLSCCELKTCLWNFTTESNDPHYFRI